MKLSKINFASLACVTLLVVTASRALQAEDRGIATNIPGVTSIPDAPVSFDPSTASDAELDLYGFPRHPDSQAQPEAFAKWTMAMRAAKHRIVPQLEITERVHGPIQRGVPQAGTAESLNWSGAMLTQGATAFGQPGSLHNAYGIVVVPVANQAFGQCTGSWDYSSEWFGIDGALGSNDVLQAGVEADALCISYMFAQYYPWFEWFTPSTPNEMKITNLTVSEGEYILVSVEASSPTLGQVFLENLNTGQYVSLNVQAPGLTQLQGNVSECILERPEVNGKLSTLANYVYDVFPVCYGFEANGTMLTPGSPGSLLVTMLDNNNQPISFPTLLGNFSLWMQDEGSAR